MNIDKPIPPRIKIKQSKKQHENICDKTILNNVRKMMDEVDTKSKVEENVVVKPNETDQEQVKKINIVKGI